MDPQKKARKDDVNIGEGEIGPKNEPKKEASNTPDGSPYDVFSEIDTYQRKIESEWESNKKVYQDKIDEIMNKFIHENELKVDKEKKNDEPEISPKSDFKKTLAEIDEKAKNLTFGKPKSSFVINVPWSTPKTKVKLGLKIFACVCAIAFSAFAYWYQFVRIENITALPYTNTSEIFIQDKTAYVVDWFRKALYTHDIRRNFPIRKIENLPNPFTTGFAFTPTYLYTVNGLHSKIVAHNLTDDHLVAGEVELPDKKLAGLFWDGSDLWTYGNKEKRFYQLRGNELTDIKAVYYLRKGNVTAFQILTNRVWVLDGVSREVYVARLQNPIKILDTFDLDPFLNGGTPTGMHVDEKKKVWLLTTNPSQMIQIPLKKLTQSKSTDY